MSSRRLIVSVSLYAVGFLISFLVIPFTVIYGGEVAGLFMFVAIIVLAVMLALGPEIDCELYCSDRDTGRTYDILGALGFIMIVYFGYLWLAYASFLHGFLLLGIGSSSMASFILVEGLKLLIKYYRLCKSIC